MGFKLLYTGFETCFGPSTQGAGIRYQNTSRIQMLSILILYTSRSNLCSTGPWSEVSRLALNIRFESMTLPPPNPSLKLIRARGPFIMMFLLRTVSAVLAWNQQLDCFSKWPNSWQ